MARVRRVRARLPAVEDAIVTRLWPLSLVSATAAGDVILPCYEPTALPAGELRDLLWALPGNYLRASDRQLAASTVQGALAGVLNDKAVGATAWAVVGRFWLAAGDKPAALSAATKAIALDNKSEHAALLALS